MQPNFAPGVQPVHVPAPAFSPGPGMRFALLVEGTVAMTNVWPELRAQYLEPVLRDMDAKQAGQVEYVVVVYRSASRDSAYAGAVVECSAWLTSVADVRAVLDSLQFLGGGNSEASLSEALVDLMAMLEKPSALHPESNPPVCHTFLMCVSDGGRVGVVLPDPPIPYLPPSQDTAPAADATMFRELSNGMWRHNHLSLAAALKHSHHMSLSVLAFKDRTQTSVMRWLQLFVCNFLGCCCSVQQFQALVSANKSVVTNANCAVTRNHSVLISPHFTSAYSVLKDQLRHRVAQQSQKAPQMAAGQAVPAADARSQTTAASKPSPRLPTPAMASPAIPLSNTPVQHPANMADPYQAYQSQPPPGLHSGMMPTPPAATPPAPLPLSQPPSQPPNPQPNMAGTPWGNRAAPAAGLNQQAGMKGLNYAPSPAQQQGMHMGMGMDASMQQAGQQMGGYPGYNARPTAPGPGNPQGYGGGQYPGYQHPGMMQGMTPSSQAAQSWTPGSQADPTNRMSMPGSSAATTAAAASPAARQQVWLGRISIASNLLPALNSPTNIPIAFNCIGESTTPVHHFDTWPRELVINTFTPHSTLAPLLQNKAQPPQLPRVSVKVQQPVQPNPTLSAAFADLIDSCNRNQMMLTVSLGMGPSGTEMKVLISLPKGKRDLPAKDDAIYCLYLF